MPYLIHKSTLGFVFQNPVLQTCLTFLTNQIVWELAINPLNSVNISCTCLISIETITNTVWSSCTNMLREVRCDLKAIKTEYSDQHETCFVFLYFLNNYWNKRPTGKTGASWPNTPNSVSKKIKTQLIQTHSTACFWLMIFNYIQVLQVPQTIYSQTLTFQNYLSERCKNPQINVHF